MKRIVIITGASRGIGRATAIKFVKQGDFVVGVYEKREDKANELEKQFPDSISMVKVDVSKESEIKDLVNTVIEKHGRIDIVVNNAGIAICSTVEESKTEDWNKVIAVNLTAKYLLSKYALPYLKKSEDGVIVNLSSRGGLNEFVFSEFVSYCVSNAGTNNFTVALAKELKATAVRVNAVIPTVTDTDRFKNAFNESEQAEVRKAGKLGTPEEVADLILSLVNDKTKTGEILIDKRVYIQTNA